MFGHLGPATDQVDVCAGHVDAGDHRHLRELYGIEVSADLISAVMDALLEEV